MIFYSTGFVIHHLVGAPLCGCPMWVPYVCALCMYPCICSPFISRAGFQPERFSKFYRQLQVYFPVSEIIGYSKLVAINAGYPEIGDGVVDIQQVENFKTNPHIIDVFPEMVVNRIGSTDNYFGESEVDSAV